MTRTDVFDQPVSLTDADAVQEWNAMCLAFLAHGAATPVHLGRLLDLAPDYAAAYAVKGLFYALLGRREVMAEAEAACAKAVALEAGNARERAMLTALQAVLARAPSRAIMALEAILEDAPSDTLAMKLSHAVRFVIGDAKGMRQSIERVMPAHGEDHKGRGYLLGCHAFALEETGDYAAAALAGRSALTLAPDDAWGLHAVAHVHDMTGDAAGGLDWLTGREAAWAHCNNFRFHVWWHKALMLLDLGHYDEAMALYDAEIRAEKTDDYRDISNATSLLSRLELDGIDVGHRWEELADLSEKRTEDGCLIFADLHYMLALTNDGRDAAVAQLLARLSQDAERSRDEVDSRMAVPGLAAAQGLEAFGEGEYSKAFTQLLVARPAMQGAGGSHAQRDVFERLTIDAGIRAGRLTEAEQVLADRTTRRGGIEDGYAAARRQLIARAAKVSCPQGASA
ncbi:tetratricopeptide repeat protein 38 family protein [Jannaschia pagri]|uniref:Tetratricopeptide repeat protein 38 n=1 Tax=Jannaschia pagri TaxID=2829797 RepID=A0ABQ4NN72_9RHOB|nr:MULTISPECIES: tetratricopeptide repeat protein [unclassified Jannaschia]GIT92023.1 tetratricopeptide repeat protein 38 family protein [Jannaschia sp. AI_61]GIT95857.1 tetratricopeptide repeat protein 38 family protein [Jannaschia sp. AI_62]